MRETNEQLKLRMEKYKKPSQKRYCEWCGELLPSKCPSAQKYHDGNCKLMGYREHNARRLERFDFAKKWE